ncbi:MAG: STAS domain-containing protein [Planctomycetota bacterium]|nr:STAS domain-containing protein [Planctomycetota bacterium]
MQITFSGDGKRTEVTITGRITYADLDFKQDPLLVHSPDIYSRTVLFNLSGVEYIDSSGVSWLLTFHRKFREAGGKLILHSLHPMVLQVLQVLRLEKVLNLAESAKHAEAEVLT